MQRITVIGGGAWGTALAQTIAGGGRDATLWARDPDVVAAVNDNHENPDYLAGVTLDARIRATADLATAGAADLILLVTPAQKLREVSADLAPHVTAGTPLVICAKGIEQARDALMSEALAETMPDAPVAVLSGPTFAIEVARGLPTAVTLACADEKLGDAIVAAIGRPTFRPYLTDDVVGAQIGGAIKNVIAIACGIVEGRQLGDNARAALMTRGLAEIMRFGRARGARPETLMGLSGLGDLTLTCNSDTSRNMSLGIALGEGQRLDEFIAGRRSVAEGLHTASAVTAAARKLDIEMPICTAVDGVVNHWADIGATIEGLLSRPFKSESV